MNIPSVTSGLSDLTARLSKRSDAADAKATDGSKATGADAAGSPTPTTAIREILAHYDMTDISPNDFSKMIQQLYDKGAISQKDVQELSSIRVDLENSGASPDDSMNLVDFYQQKMAKVQSDAASGSDPASAQPNIDLLAGRLNWISKFAAMHDQRGTSGLNAVA